MGSTSVLTTLLAICDEDRKGLLMLILALVVLTVLEELLEDLRELAALLAELMAFSSSCNAATARATWYDVC